MTAPRLITNTASACRDLFSVEVIRERALERLLERRAVVDTLIRSLEEYQYQSQSPARLAEVIPISGGWKRLSGCAR
jgi:hypothetical protein